MFVRVVVVRVFGVEEFMVVVVAVGVGAGRVCVREHGGGCARDYG